MDKPFYLEQNNIRVTYNETISGELNCCLLNESYRQGNQWSYFYVRYFPPDTVN